MNRLDREELAFHKRVRRGYRELARLEPNRIRIINAKLPPDRVEAAIRRHAERFMRERLS